MVLTSDWTKRELSTLQLDNIAFENDWSNSVTTLFGQFIDDSVPAATYKLDTAYVNELTMTYLNHDLGVYGGSVSARLLSEPGSAANVAAFGFADSLEIEVEFIASFDFK